MRKLAYMDRYYLGFRQADAHIVLPPLYRLVHTLSVRQLQFVYLTVALLVVCPVGPLPGVPGHHAHNSLLTLRHVTGG